MIFQRLYRIQLSAVKKAKNSVMKTFFVPVRVQLEINHFPTISIATKLFPLPSLVWKIINSGFSVIYFISRKKFLIESTRVLRSWRGTVSVWRNFCPPPSSWKFAGAKCFRILKIFHVKVQNIDRTLQSSVWTIGTNILGLLIRSLYSFWNQKSYI